MFYFNIDNDLDFNDVVYDDSQYLVSNSLDDSGVGMGGSYPARAPQTS